MNSRSSIPVITSIILIIAAILYRVFPHPHNFAPITGVALFGGAVFSRKIYAFLVPLVALYLGDLIINNTIARQFFSEVQGFIWFSEYMIFNFVAFAMIALIGHTYLKKMSPGKIIGGAIFSSILFFVVTNFGSWLTSGFYPKSMVGLTESFASGIPFFQNTLLGDLVFTCALFGIYKLVLGYSVRKQPLQQMS